MKCASETMRLYAVTDRAWVGERRLVDDVEAALRGGVTCVQLREKELDDEAFLEEAIEIRALCKRYGVPFFVNDNVEIAIACGADGIHVGQEDMAAAEVRRLVGEDMMIGVSVGTVEEALAAVENGADCLGVGAMIATPTKTDAAVVSKETLAAICAAVDIPVVAIGGLNKTNIGWLAGTGVDGVALVSAIFSAEDIEAECRELRALSEAMVSSEASKPKFACAIFDFDGTLFDSMSIWRTAGETFLRSLGMEPRPGLWEDIRGLSLDQSARYFREHYGITRPLKEIGEGINRVIEDFYVNIAQPKPGVPEFLEELHKKGVAICIATATDRYLIEAALKRCGLDRYICGVFSCSDVGHGKDEPDVFRAAMEACGADRETTIVFEDALHAAQTAKNDGFVTAVVFDPYEERQRGLHEICDYYFDSFKEREGFWRFVEGR